jgi:DNA-binding NtrC family response regulator
METVSVTVRNTAASVLVVSADAAMRARLSSLLQTQRWEVREACGGAEALLMMEQSAPHAALIDGVLPDLHLEGFAQEVRAAHPAVDLISLDGSIAPAAASRSPRRGELLQVLRSLRPEELSYASNPAQAAAHPACGRDGRRSPATAPSNSAGLSFASSRDAAAAGGLRVPELIGEAPVMLEVCRRICLVARRSTTVLIQGPTGSGKEVVARALHRLSRRVERPFVALNCAAIPEALLEAELFGHARGAFTGAERRRTGRIEAAQGGTLFLDEIGEMPLPLQAKLLRFLESGELQRVGENETQRVDVRIIAATHQPLARRAQEGSFRADLFYRLSVFLIATPALAEHLQDLDALTAYFLGKAEEGCAPKQLSPEARLRLHGHSWPGNVRELQHVLERASILAEERPWITPAEIEFDEAAVSGLSAAT